MQTQKTYPDFIQNSFVLPDGIITFFESEYGQNIFHYADGRVVCQEKLLIIEL